MASKKTIVAFRDGETREFDAEAWKQFPEDKYGWKQKTAEPDEVQQLKAADLIEKIGKAKTAEDVDALINDGETRTTVLKAAEDRKQALSAK